MRTALFIVMSALLASIAAAAGVDEVSSASFDREVLKSTRPVVVHFWAEWCNPCRMIASALDEISALVQGKVRIVKLNVDENPEAAKNYKIQSIPALIIFKKGKVASRHIGAAPKQKLEQWIVSVAGE
jgi:thioredoxin 1